MLNQFEANKKSEANKPRLHIEATVFSDPKAAEQLSKEYSTPIYQDRSGAYWSVPFYDFEYTINTVDPKDATFECCGVEYGATSCPDCCGCATEHVFIMKPSVQNSEHLIENYQRLEQQIKDKNITGVDISITKMKENVKKFTSFEMFKNYMISEFGEEAIRKPYQASSMQRL